jgi:hypothetical protein
MKKRMCHWETVEHVNALLLFPDRWYNTFLCCSCSYTSVRSLSLNCTLFWVEFFSPKIWQNFFPIRSILFTGPKLNMLPVWKLLHKTEEDNKLFLPMWYKLWPPLISHCCFCSCHCKISFCATIYLSFIVCRYVFQTGYFSFGMYYLKMTLSQWSWP